MSTRYINPPKEIIAKPKAKEVMKTDYDIQAELKPAPRRKAFSLVKNPRSTNTSTHSQKGEALSKFKINRLVSAN